MHSRDMLFWWMTQDNRWQCFFGEQYGWPQFKRWGTIELLQSHVTQLGGWLRQDQTRIHPFNSKHELLSEYYWTPDDRDMEMFLLILSVWLCVTRDRFGKLHYVNGGRKGLDNWKRRNGKDYPDGSNDTSTITWGGKRLGL